MVSQKDVPRHGLEDAIRVAQVLADPYGGQPAEPIDIAASIGMQPTTGTFRTLMGAAVAYDLTDGGYNAAQVSLTPLGSRIVMPTEEHDDLAAKREALIKPRVIREFLERYDGSKLPPDNIMKNVISKLGVPASAVDRTSSVILKSAQQAGVLQTINGEQFVRLRGAAAIRAVPEVALEELPDESLEGPPDRPITDPASAEGGGTKPIFVGHGKNKGPLEKLVRILDQFKIPYKVAVSEPNLGRPIPQKVKDVMSECGSAILIFTKDEEFQDASGATIWRPSENAIYELGAASYAYEDRVVIFMERGLHFPANFDSIGRIEFDESGIEAKSVDLLKELVGFGLVKIMPA
jgi:hypothetical protein